MDLKFFCDKGVLDLSRQKISIQESNSRVSDKVFTKYLFPFEFYMDDEFIRMFGDFESDEFSELQSVIDGTFLFENVIHQAKLTFSEVDGKKITGQIDFGFEDLPNWNKKLSELPLAKFQVDDIYKFARDICHSSYPYTNFNFPRMYTKKYSPDSEVWDAFDGYYNDLKSDGSEMRRNYIDPQGNIFNVNIIHPCPHLVYVLKQGFLDAGFTLRGEILTDPMFTDCWIFSGTEYFTSKQQRRYQMKFGSAEHDWLKTSNGPWDYAFYEKLMTIEKPGLYKIAGTIGFFKARKMPANYFLYLNNKLIWSRTEGYTNATINIDVPINVDFNVNSENSVLKFYIQTQYHPDWQHRMVDVQVTSDALQDIQNSSLGEDTGVITNLNEVDLTRAVPDMTFGDLVNIMRNWFNYDFDISEGNIFMNKIGGVDPAKIKNCEHWKSDNKKRTLQQQRSFLLKSPEVDGDYKVDSMYFDRNGAFLNKEPNEDTTIIDINGYAMPVAVSKPNGHNTAVVLKDSPEVLSLVWFKGLTNGQNNAVPSAGAYFPDLFFSNWQKHLQQRLNGTLYNWKFFIYPEKIGVRVKDFIKVYNRVHYITTWTKDLNNGVYEIDITTEAI